MTPANSALRGLPKRLVQDGLIEHEAAEEAVVHCQQQRLPFVEHIVTANILPAQLVATVAANEFGSPLLDLDSFNVDTAPKELVDSKLIRRHKALPLYNRGNRLSLGVCDPTNHQTINEIQFQTGMTIEPVLVEYDKLEAAIESFLNQQEEDLGEALGTLDDVHLDDLDVAAVEDPADEDHGGDTDDAPIVRFINKLLLDAIKLGASDIHFEPYERSYRVRFRIDGVLQEMTKPPANLAPRLAARLKVMSQLDISERRIPQDGRIKLKLSKSKAIDFRVNTLPTLYGEKIVLRILDSNSAKMGIDALGYEEDQKEAYMNTLAQPQGMILVTGPTGSGKTVSLYTGLGILNTPERNISTAEDPIEINMDGINQVQINTKVNLTFAEALRAFLRQDPDVIMVGEIRDLETAEISIKAAQTGHLVLSTLHTNSSPETLTRLLNMGVPAFNVATSVSLIIAQRLARRLCQHCRRPADDIPDKILTEEGFDSIDLPREEFELYHPVGCPKCTNGYKGRSGVYEVLKVTPAISRIIMEGGNSLQIGEKAKEEGFRTLRQSALLKAAKGIISLEEANRVTKD
ncbi:type IV-A pilus assembly ATPase PilB [Porticoccus sp. W117]|uniref:type IV-A pilus assembly ATPase PilB n=1 Tax=Porticoccus sp. W117 TaxID=3054777 RepID=UPI002593DC2C|nr:type IV-A pilus assembly ATPase PilB [Porticoccus sp. W117]MDM3872585.1 type IV-A pilus assembly ATPase PilB [Porticoccus sp. W117]